MSTKAETDTAANKQTVSSDPADGALTRFTRTVSDHAKSYFGQRSVSGSVSQPNTPQSTSEHAEPSIPQNEDVSKMPTAFERFMNLGKVRKDWEVEWPPKHWTQQEGVRDSEVLSAYTTLSIPHVFPKRAPYLIF